MTDQPAALWAFEAIGTRWEIGLYQELAPADFTALKQAVADRIEAFDRTYSRFRADSLVTQMAKIPGEYQLPADANKLLRFYKQLYDVTGGAVTPLIGQALSDAGYDAGYSLQPKPLSQPLTWDEALTFAGNTLTVLKPVLLDFGAAGKGYLVDIIARLLQAAGATAYYINAGGDLVCRGQAGLQVGLEHPADPTQVIGVLNVQDAALCGSAGNRRKWHDYTHILDPHSLRSPSHIAATWVLAYDTLTADGLATALFFVPAERLLEQFTFDYCIAYADGSLVYSAGFQPGVFSETEMAAA